MMNWKSRRKDGRPFPIKGRYLNNAKAKFSYSISLNTEEAKQYSERMHEKFTLSQNRQEKLKIKRRLVSDANKVFNQNPAIALILRETIKQMIIPSEKTPIVKVEVSIKKHTENLQPKCATKEAILETDKSVSIDASYGPIGFGISAANSEKRIQNAQVQNLEKDTKTRTA